MRFSHGKFCTHETQIGLTLTSHTARAANLDSLLDVIQSHNHLKVQTFPILHAFLSNENTKQLYPVQLGLGK